MSIFNLHLIFNFSKYRFALMLFLLLHIFIFFRASERSPFEGSCCGGGYATVDSLPPSPTEDEESGDEVEPSTR